ncbi:polyribonucleotide nucleotidyltransferase, partial [Pseudomonas edaphica]
GKVDNAKLQSIIEKETGRKLPLDDPRMIQFKGSVQQLASLGLQPAA